MTQTVFLVGNPITSRLTLGVMPDGTTAAAVVVRRPDGTTVSTTAVSAPVGDVYTVQWFATDTGLAGGTTDASAGDWVAVWTVTGTGATVAPKVYNVIPLPGTGSRAVWTPFLSQVADLVPYLTEDSVTPGQVWLGTFTGTTSPTDEQAQRHVDAAVAYVTASTGTVPASLQALAKAVAAQRAAATILRAFARTAEQRDGADALDRRTTTDLAALVAAAEAGGSAPSSGALPVAFFPDPTIHGDWNL
jgi:hypothetical protein